MPNDKMSREEAERWLSELTADPERMSAKMFQEGYEASLRKAGLPEAKISPLLRKSRKIYDDIVEDEDDDIAKGGADDVDWEALEVLITSTDFDPEDIHFRAAALHHVRQLNRCLAALKARIN
jgi:hypothetical protein